MARHKRLVYYGKISFRTQVYILLDSHHSEVPTITSTVSWPVRPKHSDIVRKIIQVVAIKRDILAIQINHLVSSNSMQIIKIHHTRALDAHNPALTNLTTTLVTASSAIIVEERVESSTIDEQSRVNRPETPAICVGNLYARYVRRGKWRGRKDRVVLCRVVLERYSSIGIGLPVRCLRLDLAHKDVASADEFVLVEREMLDCCAPKPDGTFAVIHKQTATGVDCDLVSAVVVVEVVVGGPLPHVFEVEALCGWCDVHAGVCCVAFCVELIGLCLGTGGCDGTCCALEV